MPLLVAVGLVGVAWALFVPPFQAPDEGAHFSYAQYLLERGKLPRPTGDTGQPMSSEQLLAMQRSRADQSAQLVYAKSEWAEPAYGRWKDRAARLPDDARRDGTGATGASWNPPLYYAYQALPYAAGSRAEIFDRFYLMRLWSALLLIVTCAATWLLAGELFSDLRLRLAAAGLAGLQPMGAFISASFNPDALVFALWALALWLGVRVLRRGITLVDGMALLGVTGLAIFTKGTGYALVPAVVFVVGVGLWRLRRTGVRRMLVITGVAAATSVVLAVGFLTTTGTLDHTTINPAVAKQELPENPRQFAAYLWQFYLGRPSWQEPIPGFEKQSHFYEVWVRKGWGAFGWLEVRFAEWVYSALFVATIVAVLAAAAALARSRRRLDPMATAFLALAAGALLAGLHLTEYRILIDTQTPINQGRYLLPLLPVAGVMLAAALSLLPSRFRGIGTGVVLGGLAGLQLMSLGVVVERFYA